MNAGGISMRLRGRADNGSSLRRRPLASSIALKGAWPHFTDSNDRGMLISELKNSDLSGLPHRHSRGYFCALFSVRGRGAYVQGASLKASWLVSGEFLTPGLLAGLRTLRSSAMPSLRDLAMPQLAPKAASAASLLHQLLQHPDIVEGIDENGFVVLRFTVARRLFDQLAAFDPDGDPDLDMEDEREEEPDREEDDPAEDDDPKEASLGWPERMVTAWGHGVAVEVRESVLDHARCGIEDAEEDDPPEPGADSESPDYHPTMRMGPEGNWYDAKPPRCVPRPSRANVVREDGLNTGVVVSMRRRHQAST